MSKEKKKTTRAAKLSGILAGFGAWTLMFWLILLVTLFSKHVLNIKTSGDFVVYCGLVLFIVAPVLAVFTGRLVNKRWETFTKGKRILLNSTSPLLILPIVINSLIYHGGAGKKDVEWYDNGNKKTEVFLKNGKLNGLVKSWYENGNKKFETNYKLGIKNGKHVYWYENGEMMEDITFKNDQKNGLETQWYENGQKKIEVTFRNDKIDGLYTAWHENGQMKAEAGWKDGERIS